MQAIRQNRVIDLAFRTIRAVAIAWLVLVVALGTFQRRLLYVTAIGEMWSPADGGFPDVVEDHIAMRDGVRLVTWYSAAKPGQPTLLMFHGNSGSIAQRAHYYRHFRAQGWGFFALSYRGFSGNPGLPTEIDNVADALTAYDVLRDKGVAAQSILAFGESLGSGVALQVAAARPVAGVVLDSPYSSIVDVASHVYWYLPVRTLVLDRYESTLHIKKVSAPVLILHGEDDRLIPIGLARRLAAAGAPGQMTFKGYPGVEHVRPMFHGAIEDMKAWVLALPRRSGAQRALPDPAKG